MIQKWSLIKKRLGTPALNQTHNCRVYGRTLISIRMKYTLILLLLEVLTPFTISQEYQERPIFRYLLAPSPDSCQWCNMRPQRLERDSVMVPRVVDLFDLPVFANLIKNRQNNREIMRNVIKLL